MHRRELYQNKSTEGLSNIVSRKRYHERSIKCAQKPRKEIKNDSEKHTTAEIRKPARTGRNLNERLLLPRLETEIDFRLENLVAACS